MDDFVVAWILGATIAAFLGLIPASLAQKKDIVLDCGGYMDGHCLL